MSKAFSAKYYQENKDYKKKLVKDVKVVLKKEKKKATIWLWMSQKSLNLVEKKNLVEYRKIYYRTRKIALYILVNFGSL